ncbi:transporter [Haloprofundus marisrubri]|uniref:Transporter n=1 Tax=Haloprofundus marisrubri TaxID=1514971 RepID=A0A0W1R436_9EURY|nr:formate/nitrite transporter family protein [Haloprofundus marisrubri]KTG07890.1 transporter [Haloprofundus marisrubri]
MSHDPPDDGPRNDEQLRDAVERARSGAPAAGKAVRDRFSADEIFQRVVATANEEVDESTRKLFFSGLAAGFAITLTFLLQSSVTAVIPGPLAHLLGAALYPLGFVYIIMGRYQLYTENTLPPVALVLERIASVPTLLRVWTTVLAANLAGGIAGAFVLANTGVMSPETAATATELGLAGVDAGWWDLFFKAVFAGWLVAGVVWLEHAVRDSISRFVLVYVVFLAIPAAESYHVVVSACEAFFLVFVGEAAVLGVLWGFVLPVLLGNTVGGVFLVTLVNYGQTENRLFDAESVPSRLPTREWLLGVRGRTDTAATDSD